MEQRQRQCFPTTILRTETGEDLCTKSTIFVSTNVFATSPAHSGMAEVMLERILQKNGGKACGTCDVQQVYSKLELCLADSQRDWKKCQKELKAFKQCYDSCML